MRIAVVAPVEETVPPSHYGGSELIVSHVARGLADRGHKVDLYAPGNSPPGPYRLVPIVPKNLRAVPKFVDMKQRESAKLIAMARAAEMIRAGRYDLVHNHASWRFLLFSDQLGKLPVVTTEHAPFNLPYRNQVFREYRRDWYVSISNNQRKGLPGLRFAATVYNGIDLKQYPFFRYRDSSRHQDLYFLARISPEKGAIEAARAAMALRKTLILNGKIDTVDLEYASRLSGVTDGRYARFDGETGGRSKIRRLQRARALIAPIQWEEPFGLMFVEAMACGAPVIAFARGAAPEIIDDGKTGYLVNQSPTLRRGSYRTKRTGLAGLKDAIKKIYGLPDDEYLAMRLAARKRVEDRFSAERMADDYDRILRRIARHR